MCRHVELQWSLKWLPISKRNSFCDWVPVRWMWLILSWQQDVLIHADTYCHCVYYASVQSTTLCTATVERGRNWCCVKLELLDIGWKLTMIKNVIIIITHKIILYFLKIWLHNQVFTASIWLINANFTSRK